MPCQSLRPGRPPQATASATEPTPFTLPGGQQARTRRWAPLSLLPEATKSPERSPSPPLGLKWPTCGTVPSPWMTGQGHWRDPEAFWRQATYLWVGFQHPDSLGPCALSSMPPSTLSPHLVHTRPLWSNWSATLPAASLWLSLLLPSWLSAWLRQPSF